MWSKVFLCKFLTYSCFLFCAIMQFVPANAKRRLTLDITSDIKQTKNNKKAIAAYHLIWDGQSSLLQVVLKYTAGSNNKTVFIYGNPDRGGMNDIFEVVKNIHAGAGDSLVIQSAERRIEVYHKAGGVKTLSYKIDGSPYKKMPFNYGVRELHRPVITKNYLYLVDYFFTMKIDNDANTSSMVWDMYPKKFTYFNNLSPQKAASKRLYFSNGKEMLMVMGNDLKLKKK